MTQKFGESLRDMNSFIWLRREGERARWSIWWNFVTTQILQKVWNWNQQAFDVVWMDSLWIRHDIRDRPENARQWTRTHPNTLHIHRGAFISMWMLRICANFCQKTNKTVCIRGRKPLDIHLKYSFKSQY